MAVFRPDLMPHIGASVTISQLIKMLSLAQRALGDVEVYLHDNEGPVAIWQVRNDVGSYIPNNGVLVE